MRILSLVFLFSFIAAKGQDAILKDSITQLEEVILIDALKAKNATGITPSDVISAKIFQSYSPVDLVSAMNQIPGVYILSGALNTNRITIRGIGARTLFGTDKLRMYYNEIPVTNGTGTSTLESYDLENLSQIEIIKGPKGTVYGANLGGAILLTPKEALGKSINLRNNFTVGSFNMIKNNLSFNHQDDVFSLNLQYGHLQTNGFRENNNFERDGFLLNTAYQINEKNTISLLINHVDYTAQIPSSLGATAFAEDPKQATFTWRASQGYETNNQTLVGISLAHEFNQNFKNTTSVFYSYLDKYEARPFGILDEMTNGYGFRTKFSSSLEVFNKTSQITFGGELYKDEYDWDEYENLYQDNNGNGSLEGAQFARNKEYRNQLNGFATFLFPFTNVLSTQVGLSVNKTKFNLQDRFNEGNDNKSSEKSFKAILLPSIELNYHPNTTNEFFANISRGYSNPSLERTLTPDGLVNPDLKQETGVNYEIGTNLRLVDNNLNIGLALYQMNINNLLIREQVGDDQFIEKNAGKSKHQGLELGLDYSLIHTPEFNLNPFINYTLNYHSFVDFVDNGNDYSGNEVTGVPKNRVTAGLQTRIFNHFYLNLIAQHIGKIPITDANDVYSDASTVFNLRSGYQKKISNKFSLGIDFGINNLTDKVFAQSVLINTQGFGGNEPRYYYPGNARNYYASFSIGYSL
ncbi:TonB-dependent receptor family protein [Maribacter sp. CXY002]|uniref:TonB-dependent receptor family protein n=1 Tax=Maribacter luteocoastalis TaxID=3407671 RepID=UPI003B685D05